MYSRKAMTGLLFSLGPKLSQTRVGASLKRTNPHCQHCTSTATPINPVPYSADYFRHKVHVHQNEIYGVTHVCVRDGCSSKFVGFITIPFKTT